MMRFNPLALGLAFGVAKAVLGLASFAPTSWMMRDTLMRGAPFGMYIMGGGFIVASLVWNFAGGVIAGALFAVIYNRLADKGSSRAAN